MENSSNQTSCEWAENTIKEGPIDKNDAKYHWYLALIFLSLSCHASSQISFLVGVDNPEGLVYNQFRLILQNEHGWD